MSADERKRAKENDEKEEKEGKEEEIAVAELVRSLTPVYCRWVATKPPIPCSRSIPKYDRNCIIAATFGLHVAEDFVDYYAKLMYY
jgi:hypothetical protein